MPNKTQHPLKQKIVNVARASVHDGPGVRTVVYFKGCNLACEWCHNPESWNFNAEIIYHQNRCIGCGRCINVCPEHHTVKENEHIFLRENCTACGKCANECPNEALNLCGKSYSSAELFELIKKDVHFFNQSGGGVTFSGGECLLSVPFLKEIASLCKENGIHTVVETAFNLPFERVEEILDLIDMFYVDIKLMDSKMHKKFTGADNSLILENIKKLSALGKEFVVRVPLIPGINDGMDNLISTVEFVKSLDSNIKIELLKYNNLSGSKYQSLGKSHIRFADSPQTNEYMENLCKTLNNSARTNSVFYTK